MFVSWNQCKKSNNKSIGRQYFVFLKHGKRNSPLLFKNHFLKRFLTSENANKILQETNKTIKEQSFSTILKNRIFHGGIIAKGSGLIKNGENGKGIKPRWYPKTLRDRIMAIGYVKNKI